VRLGTNIVKNYIDPSEPNIRLRDFPHKAHFTGTLGAISLHPSPNLWILEIQIRHPSKLFGGFFENLLSTNEAS
jgi:methionyl aminopeptidase